MSFRQFPATDANGAMRVIIEFRDKNAPLVPSADRQPAEPVRYELDDGRPLLRDGRMFRTVNGETTLTI
ncbi:hypothetical protein [Stenotrophomonas sp. MMGLT7]|uniref:hypothetical protein n=1 Tax=Stenotrophomonas sp. MMGLT7 TaxID=2901227 RepID=UPI001E5BDB75|nr:hypothetical protein [Stenotrophomonas sp. MMGLT7]MCD7098818.1 hypothetical protein [Stenotrophomonas sp. MMGLT7]